MKKRALPLLLAVLLCLTGCGSFLQREWYEVKDHSSSYYEGSGRGVLQADTYQDLVNDILLLVGNHTEEGTIRLYYGGEGLDATDAAEMACREVEHDTPLGSYAVEYLQYTLDDSARNYSEITVTISYRCINRRGKRIIPRGHDVLHEGDTVIVVSTFEGMNDLQDIFLPTAGGREK